MNLMLKFAMFSCAGLTALGMSGCKITECTENLPDGGSVKKENCVQLQPTVEYRDARKREGSQAWTSGRSISISNRNGPTKVAKGNAGTVQFSGIAFTRETGDAAGEQKAKDHLSKMADPAFAAGDSVVLSAPGGGVDGYVLDVFLPPEFDGALTIVTDNGKTELHGADGTKSTNVTSHEIGAYDLRGTVNLNAKVGDIVAQGAPSGPGNVIKADLGDIDITIGASANLKITAQSESGMVTFPMGWNSVLNDDKRAGSATLGDGSGVLTVTGGGSSMIVFR